MPGVSSQVLLVIGIITLLSYRSSSTKLRILTPMVFRRIIDGFKAEIDLVPYFVYVTVRNNRTIGSCGGSLISPRWVLTAAHCLYKQRKRVPDENLTLYAGTSSSNDFDNLVQMRHVVSSVVNNKWSNPVKDHIANHDIALMKTCTPMKYTKEVQPIALASSNYRSSNGVEALACGFGDTKTYGPVTKSVDLYAVLLKKVRCRGEKPANTIFCFAGRNSSTPGICHGDSGGPLVFLDNDTPILIGVASGTGCKQNIGGGSFTMVALYRDWIRQVSDV